MKGAEGDLREVRLTRRYRFSAAHRLHTPLLTDAENREVYGKCNNPHGHGHDYTMEVSVFGPVDPKLGRLVAVDQLDQFVETVILRQFDRRNLNVEVAEFGGVVPTTENLAEVLVRRLESAWPVAFGKRAARLEKVRIWETKRNIFEVFARSQADGPEALSDEIIESYRQNS